MLLCCAVAVTAKADAATDGRQATTSVAETISAMAWPTIAEAGTVFCGEAHDEATCIDYVRSLNTMLNSVANILEKSPTHYVLRPVSPVAVPASMAGSDIIDTSPLNILDPELADYYAASVARDEKAITAARVRANAATKQTLSPTSSLKAKDDAAALEQVIARLVRLRRDLAAFVDKAYEASYLGDAMPLSTLGPIIRGCGSLFQRILFNWEVGRADAVAFYDNLLISEKRYVETFFELYGYEHYYFHFGLWYGNRMSSFTWSHRSKSKSKSARFACGTTSQEEPFAIAAQAVLDERQISLDDVFVQPKTAGKGESAETVSAATKEMMKTSLSFYGLGWDFESRHFKVYLMVHGLPDGLPERFAALATEQLSAAGIDLSQVQVEQHGLISLTYHHSEGVGVCVEADGSSRECENGVAADAGNVDDRADVGASTLHEEKVYVYPTSETAMAFAKSVPDVTALDGKMTANVAWLLASKRGFVAQFDTIITPESSAHWRELLGDKGSKIMDEYESIGLKLETVAFQDKNSWTLYFPAGSG